MNTSTKSADVRGESDDLPLPGHSKDLIDHLDRLIPEVCPNLNMSEREIFFYAGQRHIVNVLRAWQEQDNRTQ